MKGFFTALAFCTRLPVPARFQLRTHRFLYYLPFGGLMAGALSGLAGYMLLPHAGTGIGAALTLVFYYWFTAALHLDGLADCADAFYGNRDKEKILVIMKDPRIGTMGTAAIVLAVLLKYAAIQEFEPWALFLAFTAASGFSRILPLFYAAFLSYARTGNGMLSGAAISRRGSGVAAVVYAVPFCVAAPVPAFSALAAGFLFMGLCFKKIRGYTGDCLGAAIEISETVFLTAAGLMHLKGFVPWGWPA
jgi:adenosylcobinamide-GDP ribazoletransferase